jgi:cysteine/glycine-rich protein
VFDAEKVISSNGLFHRTCYSCADCAVALDATRACEYAANREVYCKNCYGKIIGLQGYGHGDFGSVLTTGGSEIKQEYHFTQFF